MLIAVVVAAAGIAFAWVSMVDVFQARPAASDAATVVGAPSPWQLNFPLPASPLQADLYWFHNYLLAINIAIAGVVLVLILYVVWRFHWSRQPVPSTTAHNTRLEIAWTILPVLVLAAIAVPSFGILWRAYAVPPEAEVTLKVTGRQWYWEYAYPDNGGFQFASTLVPEEELPADRKHLRLLLTDEPAVLPVDTVVRIQITGGDVIHAWSVPALGVKQDAVPGRLGEVWTRIEREGLYFGQCSVLCGTGHAYMPIAIRAVSKERFARWAEEARERFAAAPAPKPKTAMR